MTKESAVEKAVEKAVGEAMMKMGAVQHKAYKAGLRDGASLAKTGMLEPPPPRFDSRASEYSDHSASRGRGASSSRGSFSASPAHYGFGAHDDDCLM